MADNQPGKIRVGPGARSCRRVAWCSLASFACLSVFLALDYCTVQYFRSRFRQNATGAARRGAKRAAPCQSVARPSLFLSALVHLDLRIHRGAG